MLMTVSSVKPNSPIDETAMPDKTMDLGGGRIKKRPATITVPVTLTVGQEPRMHYLAGARDPVKLLGQGLIAIVRVAQSDDPRWVLEAGKFLVEYASHELRLKEERTMRALEPPPAVLEDRQSVLRELRGLYAKALGTDPLVVEAEPVEPGA